MNARHMREHIIALLELYVIDAPDSDYQAGYLAGLLELAAEFNINEPCVMQASALLTHFCNPGSRTLH